MDAPQFDANEFISNLMKKFGYKNLFGLIKALAQPALDAKAENIASFNSLLATKMSVAKKDRSGLSWLDAFMLFSTQHPLDNCTEKFEFNLVFADKSVWSVKSAESLYHTLKFGLDDRQALAETAAQAAAKAGRNYEMAVEPEVWDQLLRFVSMILALVVKMFAYPDVFANLEEVIMSDRLPCEVQGPNFKNPWTLTTGDNYLGACLCVVYNLMCMFRAESMDLPQCITYIVDSFVADEDLKAHVLSSYGQVVSVEAAKAPVKTVAKKAPAAKKPNKK